MVLGVQVVQPLPGNVGIDLRGRQITVPQQHLDHPQIGAMVEQMRGKGVTQGVRRQVAANPRCQGMLLDTVPEGLARHHLAQPTGE